MAKYIFSKIGFYSKVENEVTANTSLSLQPLFFCLLCRLERAREADRQTHIFRETLSSFLCSSVYSVTVTHTHTHTTHAYLHTNNTQLIPNRDCWNDKQHPMGSETGFILRFPGNLDPRAEEFRPTNTNPIHLQPAATVFTQPTCFPYPCPYTSTVPVAVGVPYPSPAPAAAYVTPPPPPPPPYLSTSPTRSLLLSPLPSEPVIISESSLRRELEVFGDVRGVQMEGLCNGNVTVHFYDIRHAETALTAIQGQHMSHQARIRNYYASLFKTRNPSPPPPLPPPARGLIAGRAVWAQYVFPACNAIPDGQNQGTIVIFNLDSEVSAENVRELFEAFGIYFNLSIYFIFEVRSQF